jgi:transcriptional regulator with XRE-family HTH domain
MEFGEGSAESVFAANLRAAREAMGMTQTQLAELMTAKGFKWHQATVYKVEVGERQIQLGEALALADVVGLDVAVMATPGDEVVAHRRVTQALEDYHEARSKLLGAMDRYATRSAALRIALEQDAEVVEKYMPPRERELTAAFVALESPVNKLLNNAEVAVRRWGSDLDGLAGEAADVDQTIRLGGDRVVAALAVHGRDIAERFLGGDADPRSSRRYLGDKLEATHDAEA